MEGLSRDFIISALLHHIDRFMKRADKSNLPNKLDWEKFEISNEQRQMIKEACRFASRGADDVKSEAGTDEPIPLVSIFSKITPLVGEPKEEILLYYKPEKITYQYPKPQQEISDVKEDYCTLWKNFVKEFDEDVKYNLHPESLLLILKKYTSLIPFDSANQEISLFDHLKITSAIASCIYLYHQEYLSIAINNRNKKKFLLVGGDFSGVQNFVYTITTKGALKTLKARSFFLELLAEHIIHEILTTLGLSRANIISSGGGRFSLLLPNIKGAKDKLEKIKDRINRYLMDEHNARLYFILVWSEFSGDVFCDDKKYNELMDRFTGEIRQEKQHKFKEYLGELLEPKGYKPNVLYSQPMNKGDECLRCWEEGGEGKRFIIDRNEVLGCSKCLKIEEGPSECQICHKESMLVKLPEPAEDVSACAFCDSLYHLGRYLPKARYIIRRESLNEQHKAWVRIEDVYYIITDNENEIFIDDDSIWIINKWDIPKGQNRFIYPFLLGEFRHEKEKDWPYDFKDYANDSCGIKRIGALRIDVDSIKSLRK